MASATTSRRGKIVWGWSDDVFKSIIEATLTSRPGQITDISSPPGTRKTLNVIRYILENRIDAIMSFPNHQNQHAALSYIMMNMEKMRIRKLKQFVLDYAGIENYCLFYRPKQLMKLLDYFRTSPSESYTDIVQNMLANDMFFNIMLAKDVYSDELWMQIAEALDRYAETGDKKEYLSVIKQIVEKKGQYEICTNVCPLGLFAWWWRRELYKFFSEPKIITWRRIGREILSTKMPRVQKFLVHANPENFVENIGRLLNGEFKPEWVLCPRYILMTRISMSPKSSRPTFISTRKSIILTPHAGLDFVLHTVKRQAEVTGIRRRHILFLDEYDTLLLKPKVWPTISIEAVKTMIALAEKIAGADIGTAIHGVEVDEYLKRYAEYVRDVLSEVLSIFQHSVETGEYHPLVNIFIEGAFSRFREAVVKTRTAIEYQPLGARIVHIKHFLARDRGRLLQLILNPKLYFYDMRDRDWVVKYREAVVKFRALMRRTRTPVRVPMPMKHPRHGKILYLAVREATVKRDILDILRDYLSTLLVAPRYAVFYTGEKGRQYYKIRLASIDVKIYKLLVWAKSAILVSATPIIWNAYVSGSNPEALVSSEYERVVKDVTHSLVFFEPPIILQYENRDETRYTAHLMVYNRGFQKKLDESLKTGEPVDYASWATSRVEILIKQISPRFSRIKLYTSLLRIHFLPSLQPVQRLLRQSGNSYDSLVSALRDYIDMIGVNYVEGKTILVLCQNKKIAVLLNEILRGKPCLGETCGKNVPLDKISHFRAKKRIIITYFRSRATRGIDLPYVFDTVLVIGSPYPRPTTIVHNRSDSGLSPFTTKYYIPLSGLGYNTEMFKAMKTLVARDFLGGISELVQAVGRATRSVMHTGSSVTVYLPYYIMQRVMAFAPQWFRSSVKAY